ncbi:MAG: hypothetical protein CM15mP70_00500 [Pelagibacteraceae bacterium]|nr:MAG: hypothetical protein CM15mP70_00500 [Pelagibacteraceae bacterium]
MNIETSLSLSDPFCVDRHRDELKEFIEEYVDLVFCNFDEAKMFAQSETMADVSAFFQSFGKKIAMTASAEGAYYFHGETVAHQPAQKLNRSLIQQVQVIILQLAFLINIYQTKQLMRP